MNTTPTIYEYLGGHERLLALAQDQYRRCLSDTVLAEVFGTEGRPGHVEHLAAWLGEVFGGPSTYTQQFGGHGALLRRHANLAITEAQRQRFVEMFLEAADEVGLPTAPQLRRRLLEYVEWGSQIAKEVSRPGANLGNDELVPRWDWGIDGPPAS